MRFEAIFKDRVGFMLGVFLPTLVCILLPTSNSTQDGWGYAADAKWGIDLFLPHHLFYTFQLFVISKILPSYDVLLLGKTINAIHVGALLFVFNKVLHLYSANKLKINTTTFFVGASFAVLRFGTENETYIVPIFYSLVGFYCLLKFSFSKKFYQVFLAGFFLSVACLFHQIQVFWWFSVLLLLIRNHKNYGGKTLLYFLSSATMVPFFYILILVYYRHQSLSFASLYQFIFETFYTGSSRFLFDFRGVLRFFIAIPRCFIQIHSSVFAFLNCYQYVYLAAITIISAIIFFGFRFLRSLRWIKTDQILLYRTYLLVLFLLLGFGLVSYGNSEMMVAVPLLVAILLFIKFDFSSYFLFLFSISIFVWNLVFGLILNNQFELSANQYWVQKAKMTYKSIYYLRNGVEANSVHYYETGQLKSYFRFPNCQSNGNLKFQIDSLLKENVVIYTDLIKKGAILTSSSLIYDDECRLLFDRYKSTKVDSAYILGKYESLYKIELK